MSGKRYYWLRLHDDFFSSRRIKKLRRLENGDTLCLIYLKLQLAAMKKDGCLSVKDPEDPPEIVLADDIDEDPVLVKQALEFLIRNELAEELDCETIYFPYAVENTGSETASTQRSRECRKRQQEQRVLQCNTDATLMQHRCSVEKRTEDKKQIIEDAFDGDKIVPHPETKALFLIWAQDHGIAADFAGTFFDRYTANGWVDQTGSQIRNWQTFLLSAWQKAKADLPPSPTDTVREIRERRERDREQSYCPDDVVEFPYGSGMFRPRWELEGVDGG